MILLVRILLFVLNITCAVEDASILGPLRIIHVIREALIVNCAFALPSLAVDRYLSTRYPEDYERSTTPHIAFITLIISSIFVLILETLHFMNILSLHMVLINCLLSLIQPTFPTQHQKLSSISIVPRRINIWPLRNHPYYSRSSYSQQCLFPTIIGSGSLLLH
uniref:Uncharacterized protein n=1 Tax=Acrobeloides nanus TaxID=290746 RepID=A0A914E2M6_9BILA